jgi:hypothetical protein
MKLLRNFTAYFVFSNKKIILDRFYWNTFDPINLSEALFSFGLTLSFFKLCFWLPAIESIGPLQIILIRMISVFVFIIIFSLHITHFNLV